MIQILIVDDEKPICDLIQMSLTRAGYHCTCVYDGWPRRTFWNATYLISFCSM